MREHLFGACEMEDISGRVAQVALQGPKSKQILLRLLDESVLPPKYYSFVRDVDLRGIRCLISRTGYTGEFGYELYCVSADAVSYTHLGGLRQDPAGRPGAGGVPPHSGDLQPVPHPGAHGPPEGAEGLLPRRRPVGVV